MNRACMVCLVRTKRAEWDEILNQLGMIMGQVVDRMKYVTLALCAAFAAMALTFVSAPAMAQDADGTGEAVADAAVVEAQSVVRAKEAAMATAQGTWDEEDEGSALGVDEIKLNVGRLVDGVQRSAKDELMREKMDKE